MAVDETVLATIAGVRFDFCRLAADATLLRCLQKDDRGSSVLYSDTVVKINKRGQEQTRQLIVTRHSVFYFAPGEYDAARRCIPVASLAAVVASETSDELVLQVTSDYDSHFRVVRRAELVSILTDVVATATGRTLKVMLEPESELDAFVCTKDQLGDKLRRECEQGEAEEAAVRADPVPVPPPPQPAGLPSATAAALSEALVVNLSDSFVINPLAAVNQPPASP